MAHLKFFSFPLAPSLKSLPITALHELNIKSFNIYKSNNTCCNKLLLLLKLHLHGCLLLCDCFIRIKLVLPCDLSLPGFMLFVYVCWSVSVLYSGKPQQRQWLLLWCIDCTLPRKWCLKFCYTCCISSCWLKVQYCNCWMK